MKPIDVYILTGYLGAGKTTVLNHLLGDGRFSERDLALVINEFGSMGVDGRLLVPGSYAKYEINKGSIFCVCTKTDFIKVLEDISANQKADTVFIEATGIAEPGDIESIIQDPYFKGRFRVAATLCIVDALGFTKAAAFLKPVTSQVRFADGIIINKIDLVEESDIGRLRALLSEINPEAGIVCTRHGRAEGGFVESLAHLSKPIEMIQTSPEKIVSCSFKSDGIVSRERFFEYIDELGDKVLRLKGNVDFGEGAVFAEIVYDRYSEKENCGSLSDGTAFTVIAWDIDRDKLKDGFERCLI